VVQKRKIWRARAGVGAVFVHRRERDRPTTFFQGQVFAPESSVYHGENAERRPVVLLRLPHPFLLLASGFKRSARSCLVFSHARQQTFAKAVAQNNRALAP